MDEVMENITGTYLSSNITLLDISSSIRTAENCDDNFSSLNYFSLVVYSLAFLLGITGNGLVIWFTIFRMKKTVNVIWFLNLSISDFVFTLFLPFMIIYVAKGFHWDFGLFLCKFNSTVSFLNVFASVFLLTVISLDRCISVIFPVWCQNHRTPKLASLVVIVVWFLALLCSSPYFMIRDIKKRCDGIICYYNFRLGEPEDGGRSLHLALVTLRFLTSFVIPFTIIVTCYSVIALRIHRNRMTTSSKPFKVIIAVIVCFFICWAPYHIFSFVELYTTYEANHLYKETRVGVTLSMSLAYVNSCVNPFLYVFFGRDFKANFWRSIQSILEKAFNEDSELKSRTKSIGEKQLL